MRSFLFRVGCAMAALLLLTGFSVERFVENTHYKRIPAATATAQPEVIEFFSYGCPHCRAIEPDFEKWLATQPATVKVVRVPAVWNQRFEALGRFYYTLEALGVAEKHNTQVFKAIHEENKALFTRDAQVGYVSELGLDAKIFAEVYDSKKIDTKMEEAKELFVRYRLSGVPGFVVNGVYFTDVTMGGHGQDLFDVINFLLSLK